MVILKIDNLISSVKRKTQDHIKHKQTQDNVSNTLSDYVPASNTEHIEQRTYRFKIARPVQVK